jgi:hypothetical protein
MAPASSPPLLNAILAYIHLDALWACLEVKMMEMQQPSEEPVGFGTVFSVKAIPVDKKLLSAQKGQLPMLVQTSP